VNDIDLTTLDLVCNGEAPLYSTFRWVCRQLDHEFSVDDFLCRVDELLKQDILRLWIVERPGCRTRLLVVPQDLATNYEERHLTSDEYDPFALSLTLGANTVRDDAPAWEVDIDFKQGVFRLLVREGDSDAALGQVAQIYPDRRFMVTSRSEEDSSRVLLGRVEAWIAG